MRQGGREESARPDARGLGLCVPALRALTPPFDKHAHTHTRPNSNGATATIKAVGSSAQIVAPNLACGKGLMQSINNVLFPLAVPSARSG